MERIKKIFHDMIFYKNLIEQPKVKEAYRLAKREILRLLRRIRPKDLKGSLVFGTGDPAVTGEVLGVIAVFYGLYPEELRIIPDFEEQRLEGHLQARGKLRLIHVLISAVILLKDRNIRYVIHKIRAKEGTEK
ncbi:MAG: DUF2953 domain-containing protein [Lachnospiraceae bacterium]